jgi:hypothetical protein
MNTYRPRIRQAPHGAGCRELALLSLRTLYFGAAENNT